MKTKNYTLLALILFCSVLFALPASAQQRLWCPAFIGGATNGGTLVEMSPTGGTMTKVFDFLEVNGSSPMGSVIQATDGNLYGTCISGGADSSCVIYTYNPGTHVYTNLWSFDIVTGDFPMSGMIQTPNGMLYGAAAAGGANSDGVLYSFNPVTNVYTAMYSVNDTGFAPIGSPMLGSDGKLYGLASGTYFSNTINFGSIYSYDLSTGVFTVLHNFSGAPDAYPYGSLIQHGGLMYGMTSGQTTMGLELLAQIFFFADTLVPNARLGNIFSFDPTTRAYTNLYAFDSADGQAAYGSLLAVGSKLYGMTSAGGARNFGVIFSYDLTSHAYAKLHDFDSIHGARPYGDLMQSTDGNLYGTTSAGGSYAHGVTFRFDPLNNNYTVLDNFDGVNGKAPFGGSFTLVNTTTGILNPSGSTSLSAYPQPAHSEITISIPSATGESPLITITDIDGRIVWGPEARSLSSRAEIKLDLSPLSSGIYFLRAATGDQVLTQKIVRE